MSNYALRKARKEYRCSEHSFHTIKIGDTYLCSVMVPWHDMNQSDKYQTHRSCLKCAKHYGMLDSDMQKQIGCEPFETDRFLSILDGRP